ncbi:MAG: hypothetical protein MRJ92_01420 [Nitrospira sp.]|nr:hypothetical protein [Nitrospira sp.]
MKERLLKVAHGCTVHQSVVVLTGIAIELNPRRSWRWRQDERTIMAVTRRALFERVLQGIGAGVVAGAVDRALRR